jgi:hypothetical protein
MFNSMKSYPKGEHLRRGNVYKILYDIEHGIPTRGGWSFGGGSRGSVAARHGERWTSASDV